MAGQKPGHFFCLCRISLEHIQKIDEIRFVFVRKADVETSVVEVDDILQNLGRTIVEIRCARRAAEDSETVNYVRRVLCAMIVILVASNLTHVLMLSGTPCASTGCGATPKTKCLEALEATEALVRIGVVPKV
jgi:hypothetical protein